MSNWKGKLLYTDPCPVCKVPIAAYEDLEYGPNAYRREEGTEMCDYADSRGCFEVYHHGACFDSHVCGAHPAKDAPCSDCGLHHEKLTGEVALRHKEQQKGKV